MKPNKKVDTSKKLQFFKRDSSDLSSVPISNNSVSAGFPSPAEDFKETRISLDKTLIQNEDATFYARVSGNSMINAGLDDGDLLVIDKSLEPENGKIVICFIDGEFTVKRLKREKERLFLMPENDSYKPIEVVEEADFLVWGVVTYVIKEL